MELGAFSVSLAVRNIVESKMFYETLGFAVFGGDELQNWLIMKNGSTVIGLFQGMFEKNILTFNPRWDSEASEVPGSADIREIQHRLKERGLVLQSEIDESGSGPASFTLLDPDGNAILFDQHV